MPEPTLTETLVDHILAVRYDALPAPAIEMAKHVALDGIAVMLAGSTEPLGVGRIVIDYVKELGGAPQASVVAGGFKTSLLNAAYANGTMAHALDWDNTWYPLNHPTSPTLPAILALSEHYGINGRRVIEAIVTAFEVQGRVRLAATGMADGQRFHKPGTTGMFGAVAGAIRMLGLSREQCLMAFGIAGSRAGSVAINTGSMTKSSHSGHAARMGIECAMLAARGWTAHPDIFGPGGFFDTFLNGQAQPDALVRNFARPLRMVDPGVGFKKHPSNYFTHRPIDAALALREKTGFDPATIVKVDIHFPRFDYVNRPQPKTGLDGKFSVQYATAIALLDGEITVESFDDKRRFAPDAVDLLSRTTLRFDDSIPRDFDRMHCVVQVTLEDGRVIEQRVDNLTGWVGNPLPAQQRLRKFDVCARRVLDARSAARVVALVEGLEVMPDVREVMDIVRA